MTTTRNGLAQTALTAALGVATGVLATLSLADRDDGSPAALVHPGQEARVASSDAAQFQGPAAFALPAFGATGASGAGAKTGAAHPLRPDAALDVDQTLKDLLTLAWNDRRSMRDKLDDFLVEHADPTGIAIASKGVFDLVENRDVLPDSALASLYLDHDDGHFKRVLAQVASMRGDNSLIELHVAEIAAGLHGDTAAARRQALVELGRTRHVAAADLALPLLRERDSAVVLEALLALRASGNQRHVTQVAPLLQHPDEAVRWLARDVVDELQMLSELARTRLSDRDVAAELPPLPMLAPCGLASR